MREGVLENEKDFKKIIRVLIGILFICGMFFAWCFAMGFYGNAMGCCTIFTVLFLIVHLYIYQSETGCLRRKLLGETLSSLKEIYLTLNDEQVKQKRLIEEMINCIAINLNIHPWANPNYKPSIKTTIDLSGSKRFTSFRDVQRQMRIDAIFNTNNFDDRIVRDLVSTYKD